MIYVFLATGFEDIEALAPVDIIRRAGLEVQTVSTTGDKVVESAHGVGIVTDIMLSEVDFPTAEMLVLPGGMPGAANLDACRPLTEAIVRHHKAGRALAAICAAPLVFGHLGLLEGRKATCYPSFEPELKGATTTSSILERDNGIITGKGPAAAFELGYAIVDFFIGEGASRPLREGMIYRELVEG